MPSGSGPPFVRISRSLIVNLDQLEQVEWQEAGRCSVPLGGDIGPVTLGRIAAVGFGNASTATG